MMPVAARGAPPLEVGASVGDRYRIMGTLGAGAMGVVYEVERHDDGARFALKVMQHASTMAAVMRFTREAEIMAELTHENLVSVVDVGIGSWGTPFFVMQLVTGSALGGLRATRFGEVPWALGVLGEVARGLAELHAQEIVHRDLKPDNVLYDASAKLGSRVKIGDYGISRLGGGDRDPAEETSGEVALADTIATPEGASGSGSLTKTGAFMGTPNYMAPELARRPATFASDVFAFGVMAIELLTGRYPFAVVPVLAPDDRSTTTGVSLPPSVPGDIARILTACVAYDAGDRPTSAAIRDALAGGTEA